MNIIEQFDSYVVEIMKLEHDEYRHKRQIKMIIADTEFEIPGELDGEQERLAKVVAKLVRYRSLYLAMIHDHSSHVWAYARECNRLDLLKQIEELNIASAKWGDGKVYTLDNL